MSGLYFSGMSWACVVRRIRASIAPPIVPELSSPRKRGLNNYIERSFGTCASATTVLRSLSVSSFLLLALSLLLPSKNNTILAHLFPCYSDCCGCWVWFGNFFTTVNIIVMLIITMTTLITVVTAIVVIRIVVNIVIVDTVCIVTSTRTDVLQLLYRS